MELNVEKTEEAISSSKGTKPFHPPLSMDDSEVICVNEYL